MTTTPTPPEDLGLRRGTVHLSTGITTHYVERGRGRSRAVILLHGYTDSWRSFERDLPLFDESLHIYALDQRGHGDSTRPERGYAPADFAADVAAFMDALGITSASVVGHSLGSFIAQQVALDYPARVERLVLVGAAANGDNPVIRELETAVQALEDPIDPAFVREFQASTFYGPIPPEFLDTAVAESLKVPAAIWKQALASLIDTDLRERLGEIGVPTLILWGDQDGIFTLDDQRAIEQDISQTTLLVYEQTGHGLHVEQPRRFVRDVERFVG